MNWFVKWGVRKYVLGIVNSALDRHRVNVERCRRVVAVYGMKVESLLAFLKSIDAKLADGKIDDNEVDAITEEARILAEDLTA